MTKYDYPRIAQLYIEEVPEHLSIDKFKYKVTRTINSKEIYKSKVMMFNNNKTFPIKIENSSEMVQVDIYLASTWFKGFILKHYKADAEIKFDKGSLKSTKALNSEKYNHIKGVNLSQDGEVGWLLIKKEQTFDQLLKETFKKIPTRAELDIFRHANAHLSDLQDLNLNNKIKPGQVVIYTDKKNSKELSKYKKEALEAEQLYQYLCKDKRFDSVFYAKNFELLQSYLAFAREVQVAQMEYRKTVQGHKEIYCDPITINKEAESLNGTGIYSEKTKTHFDTADVNIKTLRHDLLSQVTNQAEILHKKYKVEVLDKNNGRDNFKLDKEFRLKHLKEYQKLQALINKNFTVNHNDQNFAKILKNIVKDKSNLRGEKFMGGLKLHVNAINDVGRATIALKAGQNIVLSYYIAESLTKVHGAYQTGDSDYTIKVTVNESLKISGGFIGGYYGATIGGGLTTLAVGGLVTLGTIASGGTLAIVLVGAGAVAGGVAGGYYGTIIGNEVGNGLMKIC